MSMECESYRSCEIDSCLVMLLDLGVFTGHLHPLIVHLPIGFLLLAILFELASYFKKYQHLRSAVSFTLFLGFVSAIVACVSGYVLSLSGDYDFNALGNHKTAGIFVAIVSGLLFLMTTEQFRRISIIPRWIFSSLCIVLFVSLAYTGHQGGNLTHGSDYISLTVLSTPSRRPRLRCRRGSRRSTLRKANSLRAHCSSLRKAADMNMSKSIRTITKSSRQLQMP